MWAAGFAEGEACFGSYDGRPMVVVSQVDYWPIEKWSQIFPGTTIKERPGIGNQSDFYRWHANGAKAIECMLELRDHLSPRRQGKIDKAVADYLRRQKEREAKKDMCPKGHVGFKRRRRSGGVYCTECKKQQNSRYREKLGGS